MTKVTQLNDCELVTKLRELVQEEKKNVTAQIVILRELRRRSLHLEWGYPSLMSFCEQELGLTKDQAWKRSQAAGAVEKEPALLHMLKEGKTTVSALAVVAPKLSEQTAEEIKAFVPQKSKREVEAFVSNLNRDGSRSPKKQTVRLVVDVDPQTLEKLRRARKLLAQNRTVLDDDEVLDAALEALLDKRDPVRKAERAQQRREEKEKAARAVHAAKPEQRKEEKEKAAPAAKPVEMTTALARIFHEQWEKSSDCVTLFQA